MNSHKYILPILELLHVPFKLMMSYRMDLDDINKRHDSRHTNQFIFDNLELCGNTHT